MTQFPRAEVASPTNAPRIYAHTRRVTVIGGRNNWRTHKPYRPTTLHKSDPLLPAWAIWLALAVAAPFLASMIGGS